MKFTSPYFLHGASPTDDVIPVCTPVDMRSCDADVHQSQTALNGKQLSNLTPRNNYRAHEAHHEGRFFAGDCFDHPSRSQPCIRLPATATRVRQANKTNTRDSPVDRATAVSI